MTQWGVRWVLKVMDRDSRGAIRSSQLTEPVFSPEKSQVDRFTSRPASSFHWMYFQPSLAGSSGLLAASLEAVPLQDLFARWRHPSAGSNPPVLTLPPGGAGTAPPADVLAYLGRTLNIAPSAALLHPAGDPIALVRPTGTTANFAPGLPTYSA